MSAKEGQKKKSKTLAISGQQLEYYYGSKKSTAALSGVDITVDRGVIYGLLGPSGCGKTTLLRCIIGRLKPTKGTITVYGRCPGEPGFCIPGHGVGYMPQEIALYPEITISETLAYFGRLNLMKSEDITRRISFLLNLLEISNGSRLVKRLSGGEKRRVSFAAALIHQPPLLILDEPTVGVDPLLRHSIWNYLKQLTESNYTTIIITTHYVEEARQSHTVGLMRDGHLLTEMNPELLIRQHNVTNLEDVFWILCSKETHLINKQKKLQETNSETSNSELSLKAHSNVWITQEELQTADDICNASEDENDNRISDHDVALLPDDHLDLEIIYETQRPCTRFKNSQQRMNTLLGKSFVRLRRNIPFAFFQVIVPALQVIIFCLCIGREPFNLPLAVVNLEASSWFQDELSHAFLNKISNHTFKQELYPNLSSALETVRKGKTWGAMYIGPKFTSALTDRFLEGSEVDNETIDASEVKLYFDMTNQQISMTMFSSIIGSFQDFAKDLLIQQNYNPRLSEPPVVLQNPVYGDSNPNFTNFMAPGMILGITYIMAVGLTAMSIIIEKKEGLLDRSWVSGVSAAEAMFSITFSLFVMMILQIALVLVITFSFFHLSVHGSIFWVIACVILSGACGITYGLLISSVCDEENVAMMIAMGSFYPNLLLSGIIWPVEAMNYYLRCLSYCLPLTYLAETMRSIMSRGWGITENNIWIGCVIPTAWTLIFILIAGAIFRYRK